MQAHHAVLTLNFGAARVKRVGVLARAKVLNDAPDVLHLDSLSTSVSQVQNPRECLSLCAFVLFVLGHELGGHVEGVAVCAAGGEVWRVEDAILCDDAGQGGEEHLAIGSLQAKVESWRSAKVARLLRGRLIVDAGRLDGDEVAASVLLDAPHGILGQHHLRQLRVAPQRLARLVELMPQHRARLSEHVYAIANLAHLGNRLLAPDQLVALFPAA